MNDRYIFLDIDEVLNSVSYRLRFYEQYQRPALTKEEEIDAHALAWFNYACKVLNCKVILQSTWRTGFPEHPLKTAQESALFYHQFFRQLGADFDIVDVTPLDERGVDKGTLRYIREQGLPYKNVVVVDDSTAPIDYPCRWISPDGFRGLTVQHIRDIIAHFEPNHLFVTAYNQYQPYFEPT